MQKQIVRKWITMITAVCLVGGLTACGSGGSSGADEDAAQTSKETLAAGTEKTAENSADTAHGEG